jgi:hypothetical protein
MTVLEELKKRSDDAYCSYARMMRSKPECLGWEAKVATNTLGGAEIGALMEASKLLGKHQAYVDAMHVIAKESI